MPPVTPPVALMLDTHIWVWHVMGDKRLSRGHDALLEENEINGLGVSVISCWDVANLVRLGRLRFPLPVMAWLEQALAYPGIRLLPLTPRIAVEATQLPEPFHRDPADRLLVATARVHGVPIVTVDAAICSYPQVATP